MEVKNETIKGLIESLLLLDKEITRLEAENQKKETIITTQAETILKLANE